MNTLGLAPVGRDVEVRPITSGKQVASVDSVQASGYRKMHLESKTASESVQTPNAPARVPALTLNNMTHEQAAAINAAWRQYANSNPMELARQMEQYGVSAANMAMATGQSHGAIGDMVHRAGRPQGFAGTDYFDPSAGNLTDMSTYNKWSYMPTGTYAQYLEKTAAEKNDPLSNWLGAGYPTLSETDWNAQNARVEAEKVRGVAFGGGPSPSQPESPELRMQAQPAPSNSPPSQVASSLPQGSAVSQQALSDAMVVWSYREPQSSWTV